MAGTIIVDGGSIFLPQQKNVWERYVLPILEILVKMGIIILQAIHDRPPKHKSEEPLEVIPEEEV